MSFWLASILNKNCLSNSLVRPDPETRPNPTRARPRPRFGCTLPKIYTWRVDQVLNSRPGSGSGCLPGCQELGLACFPTRYTHELARVSPWILGIFLSMNRLLYRAQWDESKEPTPVGIGLVLVEILGVEVYSLVCIVGFVPYTFNHSPPILVQF